jgi:hypothetical protein
MTKRWKLLLSVMSALILGILIYVPVVPHSISPVSPCNGYCGIVLSGTYFYSITFQLFNFGAQSLGHTYSFCPVQGCGVWYAGIFYGIIVALVAIDAGLIARSLHVRNGMSGASVQMGLGALAMLSPLLQLYSAFISEEVLVFGAVIIMTGIAEFSWFRANNRVTKTLGFGSTNEIVVK